MSSSPLYTDGDLARPEEARLWHALIMLRPDEERARPAVIALVEQIVIEMKAVLLTPKPPIV